MEIISTAKAQQLPNLAELQKQEEELKNKLRELAAQPDSQSSWWSVGEAMTISSAVLVFGLLTICITARLLRKESDSHIVLRTLGTILILTFAVFLIVAGYSDQQIAPAMGLLGTIAGYLLGKDSTPAQRPREASLEAVK
jgi:hypothetical protein